MRIIFLLILEAKQHPRMKGALNVRKIFQVFLSPLGKRHCVYANWYYTTYQLLEYMTDKEFEYTAKIHCKQIGKNFPKEIKSSKITFQDVKFFIHEKGYICVMWKYKKAKKPVIVVSFKHSNSLMDVTTKRGKVIRKPTLINIYNQSVNGCERLDQLFSYYNNLDHKTVKWWKRIFTWIIEVVRAYPASHRKKNDIETVLRKVNWGTLWKIVYNWC